MRLPKLHWNKKVIGKMKDELEGRAMKSFVGLRAKMYSCQIDDAKTIKKAKGIKKHVVKKQITHKDYETCLRDAVQFSHEQCNILSKNQTTFSIKQQKRSLCSFDDKRYIMEDGITTLPYGHYSVREEQ